MRRDPRRPSPRDSAVFLRCHAAATVARYGFRRSDFLLINSNIVAEYFENNDFLVCIISILFIQSLMLELNNGFKIYIYNTENSNNDTLYEII